MIGLLDEERLDRWLGDRLPGEGDGLRAERLGADTGVGNSLFLIRRGKHQWVLRRPPPVKNAPSASNMAREFRVLRALDGTAVPHPSPLLLCEDLDVVGAPFLLMERIDGFTPVGALPQPFASDRTARHGFGTEIVDAVAELALVDWRAVGLEGFGRPDGFLERQVGRWLGQLATYRTRDLPELGFVARWLEEHRPSVSEAGIMHGDYSMFNVMFRFDAPARLAAIIDWDTSTIGDPLMDFGHLLARWDEPGERTAVGSMDIEDREGLPTRADMAERYARRTGRDLSNLAYFEVMSLFKLACIIEGNYVRVVEGGDPTGGPFGERVPALIRDAAAIARGKRI